MDYLKHYKPVSGYTQISRIGDGGLKRTTFGLLRLAAGETYAAGTGASETALVVLGGTCRVQGAGFDYGKVGERADVFSGRPHAVYLPRGTAYVVTAETDLEVAVTSSPASKDGAPYRITPEQVKTATIGKENYQREAVLVLTDEFPAEHLFIGEAYVPSGNHASYPPHRHDHDNLPVEVDMEEIYFFRFKPSQGYGIQKIYTDDRRIDFTCTVEENDTTLIPEGYHPVIGAPGYTMYYLWIMAGENHRKFLSVPDPAHRWVTGK